ncbi:MAG: hypothetical protein FJY83_10430 [Candidatus Aminicenantes bacterium]|nr:hypothetical protein [Candidatus Aminicenantes bacterium]
MTRHGSALACLFLLTALPAAAAPSVQVEGVFSTPILLTSAGQSADVQLAGVLMKRVGLTYTLSKLAEGKDLEGHRTLVLVLGASLKGLGAAGLDMARERNRVEGLLKAARAAKIPVLCLHLGGADRRGQTTDEMTTAYLPQARMAVVVKSGNQDGFFTDICRKRNIPLVEVEKTVEASEPIKKAFK